MLLDNVRLGDLVVFSDGSQAVIYNIYETTSGKVNIRFDRDVTGWVNKRKYRDWYYDKDGSFVTARDNSPHVDIVKVIHNDQDIR